MRGRQDVERVLVVGGGVAGMTLAIQLTRRGIACHLVEIDPHWKPVGAGLTLNGATLRAFQQLGVLQAVRDQGHIHGGRRVLDLAGNILREIPAYAPEPNDLTAGGGILRPVLHAILSQETRAAGVELSLGLTIESLHDDGNGVEVAFNDGSAGRYDLVVGADGLMSKVRRLAFPGAPAPAFTGQGCWRAVFPRPPEIETIWVYMDEAHKIGLNPVSDTQMYMFLLESAPDNPWHEPEDWPSLLQERMAPFGGLVADLARSVEAGTFVNYRPLESLLLPPPWHTGRVVLIGDACHATTPHAGYGAGLAVEDALWLAETLRGSGRLDERLTRFTQDRFARCSAVLRGSLRVGQLEMARAPVREQLEASADLAAVVREVA